MDKKMITAGALSGLIVAGGLASMLSAQSAAAVTGLSEGQIIEIALLEVPGEVTDIELESEDGMQVYEVEVVAADGEEFEVEIDAETGDVLEVSAEGDDCDRDDKDDDDEDEDEA